MQRAKTAMIQKNSCGLEGGGYRSKNPKTAENRPIKKSQNPSHSTTRRRSLCFMALRASGGGVERRVAEHDVRKASGRRVSGSEIILFFARWFSTTPTPHSARKFLCPPESKSLCVWRSSAGLSEI
jgi:hypothetical protein